MTYFPVNASSDWVAPADDALGGVVEMMLMFHAACAAPKRPGARPTRGSGFGGVIETIGVTGAGITSGGGGGGIGRAPPRAPGTCAGALSCGVDCGVVCGGCANAVAISMPATTVLETSAAILFIRKTPSNHYLYGCALSGLHSLRSWNRCKHPAHDFDLDGLIGEDIRSKLINRVVLRSAVSLEEIVHHVDRTLVVLDHPEQEQPVEFPTSGLVQFGHFLVAEHSRHQHVMFNAVHFHLHPCGRCVGHGEAAVTQPLLHRSNFVSLADNDPLAQNSDVGARSVRGRPVGHEDRLRVMRNHAAHEGEVGVAIRLINSQRALLVRRLVDRLLVMLAYLDVDRRPSMGARVSHDEQESRYHAAQKCPSHRSFSDKRDGTTILQDLKRR